MNSNWSYSLETPNLGQHRRFFEPRDIEIWRITLKNNRAPLLCYFKLCASFHSHQWIQTGGTVRKRPIWIKIDVFLAASPWNLIDDIKNNRAPFLCYFKLCASYRSHWCFQTGGTVRKRTIWVKIDDFLAAWPCNLTDDLEQGKSEGFESCDWPIVRKRPIWVKIGDVLYCVTLKFDG